MPANNAVPATATVRTSSARLKHFLIDSLSPLLPRLGGVDDWLSRARDALADAAGVRSEELELTDSDVRALLDVARIAAHESGERTNAPLLCYLVGRAQASGRSLDELADAVRASTV